MLTPEQASQVKEQIMEQINSTFPEEKKESAREQISEMNPEELEEFLKKNNAVKEQQCIFCSIISGNAKAYKIDEDKTAIAILEINPISEGHILVIPKEHTQGGSQLTKDLIKKVSRLLKERLKPKDILVAQSSLFGHGIINLVPIYKDETIESERHKANQEELENSLKHILEKPQKPIKKSRFQKLKGKLWLPKRIP